MNAVPINLSDIFNWSCVTKYDAYFAPANHYFYTDDKGSKNAEGAELIEIFDRNLKPGNVVTLKLEKNWEENFLIIDDKELEKWVKENGENYKEAVIYQDPGHKLPLTPKR